MNAHRFVLVGLVGLGALTACTDITVPTGAFISCNDEGGCPAGLVCDDASGLCVREQPEPLTPVATVARTLVGQPDIDNAVAIDVDITFASAPPEQPRLVVERRGTRVGSAVECAGSGTAYTAVLVPTADWHDGNDGVVDVVLEAINSAGVQERAYVAQILVDITAPSVGAVAVSRTVDPQRTPFAFEIADDVAISAATLLEVSLVPNEAVRLEDDDAPTLTPIDVTGLSFVRDDASESPLVFVATWAEPVPAIDAAVSVRARLVDLAGNVADIDVLVDDEALHIDTIPPEAAAVDVEGAVVFERAPWGRSERGGFDVFTVTGTGAVEPNAHVLITRDVDGRREVGRTVADDAGDFGGIAREFLLDTADVVDVYVVVGDAAGNVSAPVRVRDQVFFAAMNGEAAGDEVLNPHAFESIAIATDVLQQGDVQAVDGAAVGAVDDDAVVSVGAGSFELLTTAFGNDTLTSQNGALVRSAIGFDPVRGVTLIVGGSATRRIEFQTNSDITDRDECIDEGVDDVFVRGRDGRLLRRGGVRPPAMAGAAIAFSPTLDGLVILGNSNTGAQTWLFRDDVFSPLCRESSCGLGAVSAVEHGLAWDARTARLIAHGGGLGARTFAFNGTSWTQVCGEGVDGCVAPGGNGSLVVDNDDRLLWWNGSAVHAWSGTAWQQLCADDVCASGAPPTLTNSAAAWDRRRGRLVVLGGTREQPDGFDNCTVETQRNNGQSVSVPPSADTWEFDGTTWTKATPSTSPPPRELHRMAWDELRGRVLAVGGDDCACYAKATGEGLLPGFSDDLWAFDGTTWERIDQPTAPAGFTVETTFAARDHRMTAWPDQGGSLVYGDAGGTSLHLIKDGRFYRAGDASGVLGSYVPGLATDDEGTVFGWGGGAVSESGGAPTSASSMHRLNGLSFELACLEMPEGAGCVFGGPPNGVFGHALTFDGVRVVGFGGAFTAISGGSNQAFTLSGAFASQVTHVFDPGPGFSDPVTGTRPPARLAGLMVRDTIDGTSLLYGGAPLDDAIWRFDGQAWTAVSTTTTPDARWGHVFAREAQRSAAVMTLGTPDIASQETRTGALNFDISTAYDDVYEFVDDDWHLARIADPEGDGRPRGRYGAASGTDIDGTVLIHGGTLSPTRVFGGPSSSTPRTNELWRFNGGAQTRPAQQMRVRVRASRFDDVDGATVRWVFAEAAPAEATLLVWRVDHFEPLPTTSCGDRCLAAELDATTVRAARFGVRDEVIVQLRGATNGAAPAYAEIHTDFVDVALRRRR